MSVSVLIPDTEKLQQMLIIDEGVRLIPYQDTLKNWTVGVGHLLLGDFDPFRPYSFAEVGELLLADLTIALGAAQRCVGESFDAIEVPRKHALINMAFNLGETKFKLFERALGAVRARNWSHAGDCLGHSRWFTQVKSRAVRVVDTLRHGKYAQGYGL